MKKLRTNCLAAIFSAVLILVTAFSAVPITAKAEDDTEVFGSITKDDLSLEIDQMGHFKLTDNKSGKVWSSIPQDIENDKISKGLTRTDIRSELIIEYLAREDENTTFPTNKSNSYVMCESSEKIKVSKIGDGFRVLYDFDELGIKIPVEYIIKEGKLDASVVIKEIEEGKTNYLITLEFLPYFGAAGADKNGYLFIPDGCGAIARFNQNIKPLTTYEKRVYGNDSAHSNDALTSKETDIRLPVFGTVYDGFALMGVITGGDGAASILAKTGNDSVYYNNVNSKIIYRIFAKDNALYQEKNKDYIYTITHADFGVDRYTVKYFPLSGENANYSGMAKAYQGYLVDTYSMEKKNWSSGLSLKTYGAVEEEKNFLGITYYKKRPLTTFSQMEEILNDLISKGVDKISVQYKGWSGNGVLNRKLPLNAKPLSVLGGQKNLDALMSYAKEKGVAIALDSDIVTFKCNGNGIAVRKNATKAPNGDTAKIYTYSMVTYAKNTKLLPDYLLSPRYLSKISDKFINRYSKLGFDSISLSTLGNTVYSDFKASAGINRPKSVEIVQEILKEYSDKYETLVLTGGNAYAIPFADKIYEVPVASSGYDIFAYDVPFYQMVVKGYVSYTTPNIIQSADYKNMILKVAETGSDLLFNCIYADSSVLRDTLLSSEYSSGYDVWCDKAVSAYKELQELYKATDNSTIESHQRLDDGVYKIVYSNGTAVYVNYNNNAVSFDGITIEKNSWEVKGATA